METNNSPSKISVPFAENGDKVTIPTDGTDIRRASMELGFPPLTGVPKKQGGVEPKREDFNGILNQLSDAARWSAAGGRYKYDAEFAAAIGGYPKGAILSSNDSLSGWLNTLESNTSNPEVGGEGWEVYPSQPSSSGVSAQGGWMATGSVMQYATALCVASNGDIYGVGKNGASAVIYKVEPSGNVTTTSVSMSFDYSMAFAIKEMLDGNIYFAANVGTEYLKIGKINVSTFSASVVFTAEEVTSGVPSLADGGNGGMYFICGGDVGPPGPRLRKYNFSTGVTTVAHILPDNAGLNGAVSVTRKISTIYVGYSTYTGISTNLSGLEIISSSNLIDSFSPIYTSSLDGSPVSTVSVASDDDNVLHVQFTKAGYISVAKVVGGTLEILHRIKSSVSIYVLDGSYLEFLEGNFYFSSYFSDRNSINIYRMDAIGVVRRHASSATLTLSSGMAYAMMKNGGVACLYTPTESFIPELALSI